MLVHFNDLEGLAHWLTWDQFFAEMKHEGVRGKGAVHFSHYEQAVRAARAAQGVVLGRLPVIDSMMDDGLVAPLAKEASVALSDRGYWLIRHPQRAPNAEVDLFVAWLEQETRKSAEYGGSDRGQRMRK